MRNSSTFADIIKTSNFDPSSVFLCSFDILSLFSDVPLAETIQICADALYSSGHPPTPFPWQIFVELVEMATSSVEFSFNDIMHRQIDGVAMGSPLDQPSPTFRLATMNLNFFRPLPNWRCITVLWITPS